MKIAGGVGQVGKFPISLAVASLESGDVAALVGSLKSAAMVLSVAGLSAVGLMVLFAVAEEAQREKRSRVSLTRLASVSHGSRTFLGVCEAGTLEFAVDRQQLSVPLDRIQSIKASGFLGFSGYKIELLDGSTYLNVDPSTETLALTSFAGSQTVHLSRKPIYVDVRKGFLFHHTEQVLTQGDPHATHLNMHGASIREIEDLRARLRLAVEAQKRSVLAELGEEFETIWNSKLNS